MTDSINVPRPESLLSLDLLADQGLRERFDMALAEVLANLADPNTDPNKAREITVKVKFKTTKDRSVETHSISVGHKLAPYTPMEASGFLETLENGPTISTVRSQPIQTEINWAAN